MFHVPLIILNALLIRPLKSPIPYKILPFVLLLSFPCLADKKKQYTKPLPVNEIIDRLSLKEKIGQLFAFDYLGQKINNNTIQMINDFRLGSIITFRRNIASPTKIARLNHRITRLAMKKTRIAPFIMVDQEGGAVTRIKTRPLPPSALSIGMTRNHSYSQRAGKLTGKLLKGLGFNMNLAPVLDSSDPYKKSFIGNRSYGNNFDLIQEMAQSFAKGLSQENIISTFKHFPGHGGLTQDSHLKLPTKLSTLEEFEINGAEPFRQVISSNFPFAFMVAHIAFPNIDDSGRPATFSRILINDLLRNKYNYNGLVITDDLQMAGAGFIPDIGERVVASIEAGCDIIIMTGRYSTKLKAYRAVYQAVKSGRIPLKRIHKSLRRILDEKNRLGLIGKTPASLSPRSIAHLMRDYHRNIDELTTSIAIENITHSFKKYLSLKGSMDSSKTIRVFSSSSSIYYNIKRKTKTKSVFHRLRRRKTFSVDNIMEKNPDDIGIFYVSGIGTARMLNRVTNLTKSKLIVINTTYPGIISYPKRFKAILNLNTRHPRAGEWVAQYLIDGDLRQPAQMPLKKKRGH